ncbi:hypothetical protein J7E50_02915 [Pedobacter sp. ISL-68]|uniref:hypothetical protein n=1 Tax=unclassified Pedobacter TaxID=2628915 RepID=UPI001BEC5C16|nr:MULTISPECIES: hypothetical protein [unclassified Pedobacter]MBT2560172.1 hypothetical protein [Pedobacter sp. ISL-64]MBT2589151.1 hypothetical protein [Pedobacter sp. ISL-68]
MSNLSKKTEIKALKVLAKTLRFFDELRDLDMTACDDYDATSAENLLRGHTPNKRLSGSLSVRQRYATGEIGRL